MRAYRFARTLLLLGCLTVKALLPADAGSEVKLLSEHPGQRPPELDRKWPAVVTHTHGWRFPAGEKPEPNSFPQVEQNLVDWCRKLGIRAVGAGSAWNPDVEANFQRFEGPDRNLYYSGRFDQKSVMEVAGVNRTLENLNTKSGGGTLFYLDNETPKSRMGHVWWFGYLYDYPAWHDYSQDRPIKYFENDPSVEVNPLNGEPHTRRNLFEIMAIQRKAGALGIFAHPTRWWVSDGKFITNIAAMAGVFLTVDGYIDGMAVMGDRVYNKPYQDLWFSFLDTGAKAPGFAETDFFLNKANQHSELDTFRNYPHIGDRRLTEQAIRDVARTGEVFFGNGGFLDISVDGVPMGSVCRTASGKRHKLRIEVYPPAEAKLGRIEIIGKHGTVIASKDNFSGGVLEYEIPGRKDADYVVVRAFGAGDDPSQDPDHVRNLVVSNPVYLWPQGFQVKAAHTACTFHIDAKSKWNGGLLEFQTTDGRLIRRERIDPGVITGVVPANARILLSKEGLKSRMFYIAMENPEVEKNLSYLTYGEFRKDYPNLKKGMVPPEAFHLADLQRALSSIDYELK
jgi:hypothetical protein